MTKKERKDIEHQYLRLQYDVATKDYYKIDLSSRTNVYTCESGHATKTICIDPGVTPFMHLCETCGGMANSSFFHDTHPELEPTQEWFRPTLKEVLKMGEGMREHIFNGGLDVRQIKK
jgi:hypothetical protein